MNGLSYVDCIQRTSDPYAHAALVACARGTSAAIDAGVGVLGPVYDLAGRARGAPPAHRAAVGCPLGPRLPLEVPASGRRLTRGRHVVILPARVGTPGFGQKC